MAKNFQKAERNIKIDGEYKLLSYASSSESVEMTDGTDLQTKMDSVDRDLSSHTSNTSNPHSVTKAQVGLGNVENKSSATIRGEITKSNVTTALGYTPLNQSLKGSASGLAELDSNGKVPSSQLPSYVDDVIEGYLSGGKFYKESAHTTKISGESGKIYIDLHTGKTYRWSGSAFAVISETLALGETSSTAYRGDRGKTAYDHSQSTHARTDATKVEKSNTNGNVLINGSETNVYTHPVSTSADSTSTASPSAGGTFTTVDSITRDSNGHITKINTKTVTLPSTSVAVDSALSSTSTNPVQNKVVTEQITELNSNLDNQGLLNKVTEMQQGRWNISSGVFEDGEYYVSSKESISCNGNSNIKLKCDNAEAFDIVFFNGSSFIRGESKNGSELLFTTPSNATSFKFNIYNGNKLTPQNVGKIEVYVDSQIEQLKNDLSAHTHKYAGSSSVGGSANSAVKLDSSAGSATQPVYFSSGKPVACTYSLNKSVPSDAVFTDTWRSVTTSLTSTSTSTSLAASAGKSLQDQITTLNSNLKQRSFGTPIAIEENTNPSSNSTKTYTIPSDGLLIGHCVLTSLSIGTYTDRMAVILSNKMSALGVYMAGMGDGCIHGLRSSNDRDIHENFTINVYKGDTITYTMNTTAYYRSLYFVPFN